MTGEQKEWLACHPEYSRVRPIPVVTLKNWTAQGFLFENGQFILDDGDTYFASTRGAIRVGRMYDVV